MMINVEVIARETIKPSSPTPHHLRTFKLSLLDQYAPRAFTTFVLFYASSKSKDSFSSADKSACLKKSLSQALTRYYPLAGRIKDHLSVDCNDDGALYVEARAVNCTLTDILQQPDVTAFKNLVTKAPASHLLIVQATSFDCGGMAVGVSISHTLVDGVARSSFIKAWWSCNTDAAAVVVPDLTSSSSVFPPLDQPSMEIFNNVVATSKAPKTTDRVIQRRYVFSSTSLGKLKNKSASNSVPNPTRVEVVCALLWKCRMPTRSSTSAMKRSPAVALTVNIRPHLEPPLPEHSVGNFVVSAIIGADGRDTSTTPEEEEDLVSLVKRIRCNMKEFRESFVKKLQGTGGSEVYLKHFGEVMRIIASEDLDVYVIVCWTRFGLYQADFGWGKPTWVSALPPSLSVKAIILMDTKDGDGIEALVNFTGEEEMTLFESNEDLLEHASINPSVLI